MMVKPGLVLQRKTFFDVEPILGMGAHQRLVLGGAHTTTLKKRDLRVRSWIQTPDGRVFQIVTESPKNRYVIERLV